MPGFGAHRSTQRHIPQGRADEDRLVADMIELARQLGMGPRRVLQPSWRIDQMHYAPPHSIQQICPKGPDFRQEVIENMVCSDRTYTMP